MTRMSGHFMDNTKGLWKKIDMPDLPEGTRIL